VQYIVLKTLYSRNKFEKIDMEKIMLNKQRTIVFSTIAIAAVAILFTLGPIVGNQQVFANYGYHHHHHHYHYHHHRYGGGYGGMGGGYGGGGYGGGGY
jgi:uncharacterized membrane protein